MLGEVHVSDEKLSPSVREFVDEALALEPGLDDVALQRVRARVLKTASVAVSAGSVVGLHASAAAKAAASGGAAASTVLAGAASTSIVTKVTAGLVALGLVAGGAAAGWRARPVPVSSARVVASPPTTDRSRAVPAAESQANPVVSPAVPSNPPQRDQPSHSNERSRVVASPVAQAPGATPSSTSFPEELAALERARLAVATGDPRRALRELAESDHVGSSRTFTEEREALRIVALCGASRESDGLRALVAFRTAFPRSMQIARIERACSKGMTDSAPGGHSP
jgi:hypothetical protein